MYIPLGIKSDYSLLSSLIKIEELIKYAKNNDLKALGIVDNNLFSAAEFIEQCNKNNIKPILGLELAIDNKNIYLFCRNYDGYKKLCYISNSNYDINLINDNCEDLFMIIPYDSIDLYDEFIIKDKYVGYKNKKEKELISSKKIYFNLILSIYKDDLDYIKYLYMIRDSKTIDNDDYIVDNDSFLNNKKVLDLLSIEDYEIFNDIYNRNNLVLEKNDLLPIYNNSDDFDEIKYFFSLAKKGLMKRLNNKVPSNYATRLMYELDIINKMGFSNYFLVVYDYVKYAKKNNILVGPGRGSVAGSLVSYSLGITEIDPIKYNLFFERFLNPERITMPDIDIDFEATKRDLVIDYVKEKYGEDKVAQIITFGTLKSKMVLRDLSRVFKIEKNIDSFIKLFDSKLSLKDNLKNKNIIDIMKKDTLLSKIVDISIKLEDIKRHSSIHAAGVVISKEKLLNYCPLTKSDDNLVIGFTKDYLEKLGLLKMDFLAIDNLTLISNIINEANIDLKSIDFNDEKTLEIFRSVKTDGIFQFESSGIKNVLRKFPVTSFNDLIAILALFRPGPMQFIDSYIKRKQNKEKIDYIDDRIKDILVDTYGIIVYQEQVMQIANVMAGYSLKEADMLRKMMSKSSISVSNNEREKFINQSIKNGFSKEVSSKTYDMIYNFITSFGFNKSHSVGYAYVSYQMAYLKAHYSKYFMKYLLSMVIGNEIKTKEYINELKQNNIEVLKPNINYSDIKYTIEKDCIRFPLNGIKNIGQISCLDIIKEREKGLFTDFFDFVRRCYSKSINKKVIEYLINSGCFDDFNYNRKTLIDNIDSAINYSDLCNDLDYKLIEKPDMEISEEYSKDELTKKEYETFGFYFTSHPIQKYRQNEIYTTNISKYFDKVITIYLLIDKKREIITKKKDKMAFLSASDEFSNIELIIFPKVYEKFYSIDRKDIVKVIGRVQKNNNEYQLVVNDLYKLNSK